MTQKLALRPAEAARALGVSRRTLQEWLARGLVPHLRVGRVVLIPVDELQRWLNTATQSEAGPQAGCPITRTADSEAERE